MSSNSREALLLGIVMLVIIATLGGRALGILLILLLFIALANWGSVQEAAQHANPILGLIMLDLIILLTVYAASRSYYWTGVALILLTWGNALILIWAVLRNKA